MPRDAEAWLAERGVRREPVVARPPADAPAPGAAEVRDLLRQVDRDRADGAAWTAPVPPASPVAPTASVGPAAPEVPEAPDDPEAPEAPEAEGAPVPGAGGVDGALAFIQRSTANAPQAEGRLREKLRDRGHPDDRIDDALALARARGLVDDAALLAALIGERRARGHAEPRLRRDLRARGFDGATVDAALEAHRDTDPLAAAFGLAREQAVRQRAVPPEAAVRRITAYLVRRGHGEAVARKAARDAVHADREPQRAAER